MENRIKLKALEEGKTYTLSNFTKNSLKRLVVPFDINNMDDFANDLSAVIKSKNYLGGKQEYNFAINRVLNSYLYAIADVDDGVEIKEKVKRSKNTKEKSKE